MTKGNRQRTLALICSTLLICAEALAGEFSVNPIRVELGLAARSAAITVTNEGNEKLSFQLQAMEWSQDAAGKDQYKEAKDLIFFPKLMSVEPGQEAVIRMGLKGAPSSTERTYRLFIEELPGPRKAPQGPGAQINVLIRFGVPIFAAAIKPQDGLAIEEFELKNGIIGLSVANTGNRHHEIKSVHLKGADSAGRTVYGLEIADRYILTGTRKSYTTALTAEQCQRIAVLGIEFKTDKLSETRELNVTRVMCP
jgi:fimbrial chaperone protein